MKDTIHRITDQSESYPLLLREISDPPEELFIRGNIEILNKTKLLTVVGSRHANDYGKKSINLLLPKIVQQNIIIVSGLAYGIDSESHQIAINYKKPTIAVIGSGVNDSSIYPKENIELAHLIIKYGGAIISEHPPKTSAKADYFPARNRILAGLTQATLIIQAAKRSGSLITARLALESNRDVCAVPGPINDSLSVGTNSLIQQGATPVLSSQNILDILKTGIELD